MNGISRSARRVALCLITIASLFAGACRAPRGADPVAADADAAPVVFAEHDDASSVTHLESRSPESVVWTHRGETHSYRGLPLSKLVETTPRASAGPSKRPWTRIVHVSARDGYRVVFSEGELAEGVGPSRVFLVWQRDGAPLSMDEGPFRLVVPTDGVGARCVRQVEEIRVLDVAGASPAP